MPALARTTFWRGFTLSPPSPLPSFPGYTMPPRTKDRRNTNKVEKKINIKTSNVRLKMEVQERRMEQYKTTGLYVSIIPTHTNIPPILLLPCPLSPSRGWGKSDRSDR